MQWFADNGWIAWAGLALVLLAVEVATVTFFFLMLAGGALAGAVAAGLGASTATAVVVAVIVALVLTFAARPPLVRAIARTRGQQAMGAAANVGRDALALRDVTAHDGRVRLAGEVWTARSADGSTIPAGTTVEVTALDGATAVVAARATHPQAGTVAGPTAGTPAERNQA